ncbi:MAG: GCN5-related N-acetyltransferase [Edaphobacter sp.]|nr:GCN5-related N-acetyltransferase [Edaphobacter sp.]
MSATGMQIRLAHAADLDAIVRLERAVAEAPHWAEAEYAAMLVAGIDTVRRCLFVGETDGRLIGFAVGKVIGVGAGSSAELESVAVDPEARRGGVGRMLCFAVIGWCREQGVETMDLEVRAASAGAIALYIGMGFVAVGRRRGYYIGPAEDALLMKLKLANGG